MAASARIAAFLSYSSVDSRWVRGLHGHLERVLGRKVWLDAIEIRGGRSFPAELQGGLEQSSRCVLVVTPYSMASPWVQREVDGFLASDVERDLRIVPVLREQAPLPALLQNIHAIDFRSDDPEEYRERLRDLAAAIQDGRGSTAVEVPDDLDPPEGRRPLLTPDLYQDVLDATKRFVDFHDVDLRQGFAHAVLGKPEALEAFCDPELRANAAFVRSIEGRPPLDAARSFLKLLAERRGTSHAHVEDEIAPLLAQVEELAQAGDPQADPLAEFVAYTRVVLEELVTFQGGHGKRLRDVYVEVLAAASGERDAPPEPERVDHGPCTLEALLRREAEAEAGARRWCVRGQPGAGKTTALREFALKLLETPEQAVPLYLPLREYMGGDEPDPVRFAVGQWRKAPKGLEEALHASTATRGPLVLLFDGLDELGKDERGGFRRRLVEDVFPDYGDSPVLVTSRHEGYEPPAEGFRAVDLQPLGGDEQLELASCWMDSERDAERLLGTLPGRLQDAAGNPLLLTLIARTTARDGRPPRRRSELYDRAVDLCLSLDWHRERNGVIDKTAVRDLLPSFVLHLAAHRRWSWSLAEVDRALKDTLALDGAIEKDMRNVWGSREALRNDLAQNAGLIGDQGVAGGDWTFLHRTLGEFLLACALAGGAKGPELDLLALLRDDGEEAEQAGEWGETLALLVGLLPSGDERRSELLDGLVAIPQLALRHLPELEGLAPAEAFEHLQRVEQADGMDYRRLVHGLLREGHPPTAIREAVLAGLKQVTDLEQLAFRYYALVSNVDEDDQRTLELDPGREAFFAETGHPLDAVPERAWARVPAGGFEMGEGDDRHWVDVPAFELATEPVTEEDYRLFDRARPLRPELARHPVVEVSWWEAWLYARWAGERLPSEAEWEYACRAGSSTPWSTGDSLGASEANISRKEDEFDRKNATTPVGKFDGNDWGLRDMHGNVWEWCQDLYDHYRRSKEVHPAAYEPLFGAESRVLRGGSFRYPAGVARSAYRHRWHPRYRNGDLGFRLARVIT